MTPSTHPMVRPQTLFYLGTGLLLAAVAARTVLTDAVVALYGPSQEQFGWLFTAVGLVSTLTIALGTGALVAAVVLLGLNGGSGQGGGREGRLSIQVPGKRQVFLSDAVVLKVEDFAQANGLATDEAIDRLMHSGLRATGSRIDL